VGLAPRRWGTLMKPGSGGRGVSHPLPVLAVGLVMAFLSGMALRAWSRSRNRILLFVCAAFAVFALKEFVTAFALYAKRPGHEDLELLGTILDLGIAALLVAPFVLRARDHA
jgi:hypothetical protein